MTKWEYISGGMLDEKELNDVGRSGWELVSVVMIPTLVGHDGYGDPIIEQIQHGYFKRPVK